MADLTGDWRMARARRRVQRRHVGQWESVCRQIYGGLTLGFCTCCTAVWLLWVIAAPARATTASQQQVVNDPVSVTSTSPEPSHSCIIIIIASLGIQHSLQRCIHFTFRSRGARDKCGSGPQLTSQRDARRVDLRPPSRVFGSSS